jgi:hypothetical protein
MNLLEFEQMCRDTSVVLGVEDTSALGLGFSVPFAGVLFETSFQGDSDSFLLMAELGAITAQDRLSVYEHLLTCQLITWNRPGLRFGFHPQRRTVVLCVEVKSCPQPDGAWLATLMRSIAAQAFEWRKTLLTGNVDAAGEQDWQAGSEPEHATLADLLARRA